MSEPLVSMNNVGRTYMQGKVLVNALEGVTCQVATGDRIAVIGSSGSGKSTLLHLMGGVDSPTAGMIAWPALGGKENLLPRNVGFVFQTTSLLAFLTAVENTMLPLLLAGVNPVDAREAAVQALQDLELESLADKLSEELSGGQAQRIAVARALASHPRLILADEPTGQLDHPTARRLLDVLLAALETRGTALVVATHDSAVASRMKMKWQVRHGKLEVRG